MLACNMIGSVINSLTIQLPPSSLVEVQHRLVFPQQREAS